MLLFALVAGAWKFYPSEEEKIEFESARIKRGSVTATVSATGTLESTTTVTVGSQVSAPVQQVLVDFNSSVQAGDVLAILDDSEFEARVAQNRAGLENSQANLLNAQAKLASSESAISQAQAQIESAQAAVLRLISEVDSAVANVRNAEANVLRARAEMENAQVQFKRFEQLYARQLIAASELDQNRTSYRVAAAAYETALATKDESVAQHRQALARSQAGRSDLKAAEVRRSAAQADRRSALAQIASAQAQVRQAQANLEQATVDVERAVIRSPIRGVVISRKVDVGQTVAAAFQAPELFEIAQDLHEMQVRADVSEADIGQIRDGQKVVFTVDAHPDKEFEGRVVQVRSAPEEKTEGGSSNVVVYGVLVTAPNPELLLKPGMTATVKIQAETHPQALLVPNEALRFVPPKPPEEDEKMRKRQERKEKKADKKLPGRPGAVWIETADRPEKRDLRLGISDGDFTEVLSGDLKEGESVLVDILKEEEKPQQFRLRL
ncbi:MAG: HlyD family secretion protein [Armatimonadetes bacterium]|nr:HlyD family secretion protein [Armatimonadota bacterium]